MALTQSARLPGPSWDEEVVPALRKRLESESRTLAHRMSAISLSSVDEPPAAPYPPFNNNVHRKNQPSGLSNSLQSSGNQRQKIGYQPQPSSDRTTITTGSRPIPTNNSNGKSPFQRARTYSSPYASNPDSPSNGTARPKMPGTRPADTSRSLSPRPVDMKPTRIPKATRPSQVTGSLSNTSSPYMNGYSHSAAVTPDLSYHPPLDQRLAGSGQRDLVPSSSTKSTIELAGRTNNQPSVLLNEPPPFAPSSASSYEQEDPPRPSMESEERPYEHWYRGEVSRNGGVGELRVGRRQEMLDIANYGHLIRSKKAAAASQTVEPVVRTRKRAGSIGGITNKERERGSLYLDDEHANEVSQVLDEHPLTDLDGEGSDINSISDRGMVAYAYLPDVGDVATPTQQWTETAGAHELRSTTPTPSNMGSRTASRQNQNLPPTRIPVPSSRRSSESRSTATMSMSASQGGPSRSTEYNSSSSFTTSSPPQSNLNPTALQQSYASHTVPAGGQKRGPSPSPAPKKTRTVAGKATRAKIQNAKGKDHQNRESVAQYPTPGEGDEEDMADAIPSWTQPVPREGNWDEVVLPVVARKKGLDGYYENANGSPQPKKIGKAEEPAPAPGTFGFDHSKYRPPRVGDFESIPMDEFGRPARPIVTQEDEEPIEKPSATNEKPSAHDETRLPVRQPPPSSPVPFAQYAPTSVVSRAELEAQAAQRRPAPKQMEEDDKDAGCCKCIIM